MILRGIKRAAPFALIGAIVAGCTELPGGETGPFAPGNTLTFYYQSVLTDPPTQATIVSCGDQFIARSCIVQPNGSTFQLEATEMGVAYGGGDLRVVLRPDAGGLPSGIGQLTNTSTGDVTGMRWISLPTS